MATSASDRIELRGLRATGLHGLLPEERGRAQPFEVDLELELDLAPAGRSDDLGDTIDYGAIAEMAVAAIEGEHADLLEHLAERIANGAFELVADGRLEAVTVSVRKLRPPVPVDMTFAGVRVHRRRSER